MTKRRISASIDPDLLSAAEAAVKRRGSSNFSARKRLTLRFSGGAQRRPLQPVVRPCVS
jgi:hypothetical protein